MRLGVLGGTFNPIHNGHLAMADAVRRAHGLDRVLLVPSARPPHKAFTLLASPEDRLEMVRLAVECHEGLEACAIEVERPGTSFTVDTLEELRRRYPGDEIFFIIGADSVPELSGWRNVPRILELARVVVVNRPGHTAKFRAEDFPGISPETLARLEADHVTMPACLQESRRIRESIRRGESITGDVPAAVASYLKWRGLYTSC